MDKLYVTNPYDTSPVGEIGLSSESEVETALETASKTHQSNRKGLPRHERIAILKKTAEIMAGRSDELAMLIAAEGGKPLREYQQEDPLHNDPGTVAKPYPPDSEVLTVAKQILKLV